MTANSSDLEMADRPFPDGPSGNGRPRASSTPLSILLIDDNAAVAQAIAIAVGVAGHRLTSASKPDDAYSLLAGQRFDAILLDLNFSAGRTGGEEGLACLARILAADPDACILTLTAHSGIRIAVAAMQAGARDFLMKPWRNAELVAKIEAAARRPAAPNPMPPVAVPGAIGVARLLGDSAAIDMIRSLLRRVAPTDAPILIHGPEGSGRSLAALALHEMSERAAEPHVSLDLRDGTAWSRLDTTSGTLVLRHADRLDEIGEIRVADRLTDRARIVAIASDPDAIGPALRRRLATIEIAMPPLAARPGDAALLARHFAREAATRYGRPAPLLSDAALDLAGSVRWPGEIAGLALAVERAVLLSEDGRIDAALLMPPAPAAPERAPTGARVSLADREKAAIEATLSRHQFNVTQAAAALGLSRGALYRRMARYGL